jgi:hypothetical protein
LKHPVDHECRRLRDRVRHRPAARTKWVLTCLLRSWRADAALHRVKSLGRRNPALPTRLIERATVGASARGLTFRFRAVRPVGHYSFPWHDGGAASFDSATTRRAHACFDGDHLATISAARAAARIIGLMGLIPPVLTDNRQRITGSRSARGPRRGRPRRTAWRSA